MTTILDIAGMRIEPTTLFSLKSIPTVEINFPVKALSVYWNSKLVLPTPVSPVGYKIIAPKQKSLVHTRTA